MPSPENFSNQFANILSSNYSKCPGCSSNYVTEASPTSSVDNTTKVCSTCSAAEGARSAIANVNAGALLDNSGSLERLSDSYSVARGLERAQDKAQWDSHLHASRVRNASVPVPNPSKTGKWNVSYDKNRFTGDIEAHADNGGNSHYARLDHETGKVGFGAYGTNVPPKTVQDHITKVLTKHHKTYIQKAV